MLCYSQNTLSGRIVDPLGAGIHNVNIFIQFSAKGTISDSEGYFQLELENGSYEISISSLGYASRIIHVTVRDAKIDLGNINLDASVEILDEAVISGSRRLELMTQSAAAINLINAGRFENFIGSPEELFALQKGVDFSRIGNFWGNISIRGFNSAFNQKMLLLDDNRISHTRIRTPVGPMSAFVKEDVERVEIVLGPSSALYGPNCLNGLFNTLSKSPFQYPGTDIVMGAGSNELLNFRFRHAHALNKNWAYKVTSEYISGREEEFTDSVYIATSEPGVYEGKAEIGVARDVNFLKGLAAVFYKPGDRSELGINYTFNESDNLSGGSRNNLSDWNISSLQATYKSGQWFSQLYKTWIRMDRSVSVYTRTLNYYTLLAQGQSEEEAFANSLNGPRAAVIKEDSHRWNAEVQYNASIGNLDMVAGFQFQKEAAFSNHTYLLDEEGPIKLSQYGLYGQIMYDISESGIQLVATVRADEHSLFGFNFLPKVGVTFTKNRGTWRLTFGEGFSTPTIINTHMSLIGGMMLGNSDGYTLSDGTKIAPIAPETIQTLELGYKDILMDGKLYLDMDIYYNWAKNMISPIINIVPGGTSGGAVVTHRGNRPITDFTQGPAPGTLDPGAVIFTNINFGEANTYGFDIGLNYYFTTHYNLTLNYSYFDYSIDRNDLKNDVNSDGRVDDNDMSINTPKNKISSAFNAKYNKFQASVFARWIQKFDFFSGGSVAARTNLDNIYNGSPVIEGSRVGDTWNYGPLGGFYLSSNGSYQLTKSLNLGLFVNNILGRGNYEFISSPPTETTFGIEAKLSFN